MTREQMISTLRGMDFGSTIGSKGDEALRMAIAELEQEPCDTISRDAVLKRIAQFSTEEGSSVECQPLYSDVYNMPSVQPSRKGLITKGELYEGEFEEGDTDAT